MWLSRGFFVFVLSATSVAFAAKPTSAEKTVAKFAVTRAKGAPINVWVTRERDSEGGIIVKLVAQGAGAKAQAVTVYEGGGADDGAGDAEVKDIVAKAFALPGGAPAVRVDVSYRVPDGRKKDEQIETILIGLEGKPHRLLELVTYSMRDKTKTCREGVSTQFAVRAGAGGAVDLLASTTVAVEPALGDDDLPIDKTCKAPAGASRVIYRLKGDAFEQIDPPPAPKAPAANAAESDDDDD